MKKYNTVIFDLDGTLLNTLKDLTDATNDALEKYGQPQHSMEDVRKFVGNGIRKLIERAVEGGDKIRYLMISLQRLKNIMVCTAMILPASIREWKS